MELQVVKVRDGVELSEYNGWENKFTWLMHLHLSNDQVLMQEIAGLVATTSSNRKAGRLIATWVKVALFHWLGVHPERDARFDGNMHLLAWDLVGSALAYADWDALVTLLTGRMKKSKNLFTVTLSQFILSDRQLLAFAQEVLAAYPNMYQCADVMKGLFREQVDALFAGGDVVSRQTGMLALVNELMQNTYTVIAWEHVAKAFRPEY
jgi:hypothetical protein